MSAVLAERTGQTEKRISQLYELNCAIKVAAGAYTGAVVFEGARDAAFTGDIKRAGILLVSAGAAALSGVISHRMSRYAGDRLEEIEREKDQTLIDSSRWSVLREEGEFRRFSLRVAQDMNIAPIKVTHVFVAEIGPTLHTPSQVLSDPRDLGQQGL